jgi:hypothetical protein
MHDDHYIEANSSEGIQLRKCFQKMRSFPPFNPAGAPTSNIATRPSLSQSQTRTTPTYVSNPIFPPTQQAVRQDLTQAKTTTTAIPSSVPLDFTQVKARRDPREGKQGWLYQAESGGRMSWIDMGPVQSSANDGKPVVYSERMRVWAYADG